MNAPHQVKRMRLLSMAHDLDKVAEDFRREAVCWTEIEAKCARGGEREVWSVHVEPTFVAFAAVQPTTATEAAEDVVMCTICRENMCNSEIFWLPCSHAYHLPCVAPWLKKSGTCPLCRSKISPSYLPLPAVTTKSGRQVKPVCRYVPAERPRQRQCEVDCSFSNDDDEVASSPRSRRR